MVGVRRVHDGPRQPSPLRAEDADLPHEVPASESSDHHRGRRQLGVLALSAPLSCGLPCLPLLKKVRDGGYIRVLVGFYMNRAPVLKLTSLTRVARRPPDSVTIQEIFDEPTAAHNDMPLNRGFFPWQLLLEKTPSDKSVCESPDLAQCSVEVVDEAAKQRLRLKEEWYKANIEEELSLRKRRKEIHQARPWRHWTAGEWCWYWRSGKHKGSRIKCGMFFGRGRVLLQERETTAEGVRMKGVF